MGIILLVLILLLALVSLITLIFTHRLRSGLRYLRYLLIFLFLRPAILRAATSMPTASFATAALPPLCVGVLVLRYVFVFFHIFLPLTEFKKQPFCVFVNLRAHFLYADFLYFRNPLDDVRNIFRLVGELSAIGFGGQKRAIRFR